VYGRRIGAVDVYECGIFGRVQGWVEGMGVEYTVGPKEEGCMMHKKGACFREFEIPFGYSTRPLSGAEIGDAVLLTPHHDLVGQGRGPRKPA